MSPKKEQNAMTKYKPHDTVTYDLMYGNKVVYKGITNDPGRREQEHRDEGKRFSGMRITSRRMTREGAKEKESEALEQYHRDHGRLPKYNDPE